MAAREYKLRPSISWKDLELVIKVMDKFITEGVTTNKVTKVVLETARIKQYFETFKPAESNQLSEQETLVKLMAKYGINTNAVPVATAEPGLDSEDTLGTAVSMSPEDIRDYFAEDVNEQLTDDERYDKLKLTSESKYTPDDKLFMLNQGTLIMMQRAGMKSVKAEDL